MRAKQKCKKTKKLSGTWRSSKFEYKQLPSALRTSKKSSSLERILCLTSDAGITAHYIQASQLKKKSAQHEEQVSASDQVLRSIPASCSILGKAQANKQAKNQCNHTQQKRNIQRTSKTTQEKIKLFDDLHHGCHSWISRIAHDLHM